MKQTASGKLLYSTGSSAWCCDDEWDWGWRGGREAQEGRDLCILTTGSHCCTGETNIIIKQLFSNLKKKWLSLIFYSTHRDSVQSNYL